MVPGSGPNGGAVCVMVVADEDKTKERRALQRTRVKRSAKIIVPGRRSPVIHCTVQNITSAGACLKLANTYGIPETFDLTFECGRTRRACRVVWRTADKLGVAFQGEEMPADADTITAAAETSPPLVPSQAERRGGIGVAANDNISPRRVDKRIPAKPPGSG